MRNRKIIFSVLVLYTSDAVFGHGMLVDPPNRGMLGNNYDAHGLNCGGFGNHHYKNKGKCGICGDDYSKPVPRPNEHGGFFGKRKINKWYYPGSTITVTVRITANHKGYFTFDLCNLIEKYETEECFKKLKNEVGEFKFPVGNIRGDFSVQLVLPHFTCKHCVLRWQYTAGNNWGNCGDGREGLGCGPQETFRTCSDISILGKPESNRNTYWGHPKKVHPKSYHPKAPHEYLKPRYSSNSVWRNRNYL